MTVKAQKPIVIFRGDNTAAFDLRTITILLTGDLDLSHATAEFTLLDFSKTWTEQEVATGELSIVFTDEQTNAFALGPQTGTLRLYDMSTGTPRQLTIVNKIPFFVTNRVCEIDSQSYEADVCVSGGDVIHIEFNVGAGAVEGKADKVKSATAGDLASLTLDGNLEDSGIPKTDVLRRSQMDSTPTAGSQNPVTSDGIKQAIDAATPGDYAQVKAQVAANTGDITEIESLIPAQASAQNQLADRNFVNSSIATNTATFRGSYNLVSDLGLTVSATEQQVAAAISAKLASLVPPVVPENNDYVFVQVPKTDADPTVIERVDRYKCTVTESGGVTTRVWEYEWSLNNSSFTADQWAAINSGMTAADVTKLAGIEAGAQVNAVTSVNLKTGAVRLGASDVGALPTIGGGVVHGGVAIANALVVGSSEVPSGLNTGEVRVGNIRSDDNGCTLLAPNGSVIVKSVSASFYSGLPVASSNSSGIVKIGSNISVNSSGVISVPIASTGAAGVVQISNTPINCSCSFADSPSAYQEAVTPRGLSLGLRYMIPYRGSSGGYAPLDRQISHLNQNEMEFAEQASILLPQQNDPYAARDFIVDVDYRTDNPSATAHTLRLGSNYGAAWRVCVAEGEDLTDILTFNPGDVARLYFTETAFRTDYNLVFLVARQNVEMVEVNNG